MKKHPIVNIADIELQPRPAAFQAPGEAAERFDARMGRIGERIGARQLGYNITCVPPGKRAFPFHSHRSNEEMFFVLEGSGQVRIGADTHPIRAGDFIACPTGGPETAHQIVNTGNMDLKYLAVSTGISPEVCEYPDSGKFAVSVYKAEDDGKGPWAFRHVGKPGDHRDYWEGE